MRYVEIIHVWQPGISTLSFNPVAWEETSLSASAWTLVTGLRDYGTSELQPIVLE
jgi:hypothetical protein